MLLGIRSPIRQPETQRHIWRGLIGFIILLLVIAIPLAVIMRGVIRDTAEEQMVREILTQYVEDGGGGL